MEKLGINPTLLGFQLFNFIIVLALLNFLVLKPLSELMEKRKKKIEAGLAKEGEVDLRLSQIESERSKQLTATRLEIDKMMAEAAKKAVAIKEDVLVGARKEAEAIVSKAHQRIAIERDEVLTSAKNEVAELTIKAVEQLFNDKRSSDTIKKQINQATIDKLWQTHQK